MKYSLIVIVCSIALSSCFKDNVLQKYTYYKPVYASKTEVRANIKSNSAQSVQEPGKIFVKGTYIYLNDVGKGVHIIDYSNPAAPQNIAFIPIPGNVDIAVNGNYLYADEYSDLLTIDITNPRNARLVDADNNVFTSYYPLADSNTFIVDWIRVDTMIKKTETNIFPGGIFYAEDGSAPGYYSSVPKSTSGTGGSMARFTLLNNRLYTISGYTINTFTVTDPGNPSFTSSIAAYGDIETIYPFNNTLFVGANSGMHMYDVSNPDQPVAAGDFTHAYVCDPVIADGNNAYVTLRSGTSCQGFSNELDVLDVTNLANPVLIKTYPFSNPHGLAKDGNNLFICDGTAGLKILNAAEPDAIDQITVVNGMEAYDVIAVNGIAVVTAQNGLFLVDYKNPYTAHITGSINIHR